MTAYTPLGGIPYPQPTDPANVPQHLQSLAETVDARTILRFASAAARDTVITAPAPGMVAWLSSPGQLTYYTGTAWQAVPAAPVFAYASDLGTTNSTAPVEVLPSGNAAPTAAVFTAPLAGKALVTVGAWINNSVTTSYGYMGATVRKVSDSSVLLASSTERACTVTGINRVSASSQFLVTGLTAGVAYSVTAAYWSGTSGNTVSYDHRFVRVDPL
ncbi:hypothetical protein QWJ26_07385 [Streptomyces sp. CSDS2]|uniref:hypothetical protein n=1 Tax=Streptomyces sp. CSDS2 TaxID=3055051 RepID=UPI0025AFF0BC|nr:hypothetical protein [Streptomyces sp. CSDS2]MDN3259641.1 hypothetical protein [Streptomyces sp. CSDS2]